VKKIYLTTILLLAIIGCIEPPERAVYKYASPEAWDLCMDTCPGAYCPCILGPENTWYISPEVGE